MRMTLPTMCLCLLAAPLAAQEVADRYEVIGTLELEAGGERQALHVLRDTATGQSFANFRGGMFKTLGLTAVQVDAEGLPSRPFVTLTLGPWQDSPGPEARVEWLGEETTYQASHEMGAPAELQEVALEDDRLSFRFTAELREVREAEELTYEPVEDGATLRIEGSYEGSAGRE